MTTTETATSTRQGQLLARLVCPECRSSLAIEDAVVRHDGISAADLHCASHGRIGVIDQHRPSFCDRELAAYPAGTSATRLCELPADADMVRTAGRWWSIPEGWAAAAEPGVAMVVSGAFRTVAFEVLRDQWSPTVELVVDGKVRGVYDLADRAGGNALTCVFESNTERTVMLRVISSVPAGRMVVTDARIEVSTASQAAPGITAVDRGSRFPLAFLDLLAAAPADAVALDCGGGDRRLGDPRLFNLDCLPLRTTDVNGDCLRLPFADNSFDLVLSQSVLEYVPDPMTAVDEMYRILRPGGTIYAQVAFHQSTDSPEAQYFAITAHGAEYLFRNWNIQSLDGFGGTTETLESWAQLLDLDSHGDQEQLRVARSLVAEIDLRTPREKLQHLATGVSIVATRP